MFLLVAAMYAPYSHQAGRGSDRLLAVDQYHDLVQILLCFLCLNT